MSNIGIDLSTALKDCLIVLHERPQGIADWAYKVADAMLVERAKP